MLQAATIQDGGDDDESSLYYSRMVAYNIFNPTLTRPTLVGEWGRASPPVEDGNGAGDRLLDTIHEEDKIASGFKSRLLSFSLQNDESSEEIQMSERQTLIFGKDAEIWYKYTPDSLEKPLLLPTTMNRLNVRRSTKLDLDESSTSSSSKPPAPSKPADAETSSAPQYAMFITRQTRVKECLDSQIPKSLPKNTSSSSDVDIAANSNSGTPSTVGAINGASVDFPPPAEHGPTDDWRRRSLATGAGLGVVYRRWNHD
ncbi:hypothetical protein F5050DRAFT_1897845 [Lentinula boryana]|uniref:Uncharacterized protein n=1 Tax=Lentinula boryana TaxID=40481 RepID=A0ABQ8Q1Z3_9AGAR|nr:hypothetical protein F5050DRAFT_1897845 [Lentinula boryana]